MKSKNSLSNFDIYPSLHFARHPLTKQTPISGLLPIILRWLGLFYDDKHSKLFGEAVLHSLMDDPMSQIDK